MRRGSLRGKIARCQARGLSTAPDLVVVHRGKRLANQVKASLRFCTPDQGQRAVTRSCGRSGSLSGGWDRTGWSVTGNLPGTYPPSSRGMIEGTTIPVVLVRRRAGGDQGEGGSSPSRSRPSGNETAEESPAPWGSGHGGAGPLG
jgi:hypothetical protein